MAVEKGTFTPIVFNTTGGMAREADKFLKRLAEKLAWKRGTPYPRMASFVRKRMRFDLTKTILIALRGYRGKPSSDAAPLKDLDIHLEKKKESGLWRDAHLARSKFIIQRASPACSASFRPSQQGPAPHIFFSPDFGEFFKLAPRAVITYYHHARKSVRSKPLSIVT